jgi:hypothetical protein
MTRPEVTTLLWSIAAHGLPGSLAELPRSPLSGHAWHELLFRARGARLSGLLTHAVTVGALPATDVQAAQVRDLNTRVMASAISLEAMLLQVAEVLDGAGIPFRVLKGPAVAHLDYPDPAVRDFGDVDLLVPPQDLDRTIAELVERGCARRFPEPRPGFDRRFTKSVSVVTPEGQEIDLHRTLAPGPFGLRIRVQELWETPTTPFMLGGRRLTALGPEERLVHACYHAVLGDVPPRLVPQRDIAQMLLYGSVDPTRVRELAGAWGGEPVIAHAVRTAWANLRLADVVALSAWAARYTPAPKEERELARATSPDRSYATQTMASVRTIPRLRDRLAYISALAFPRRSYLDGRHAGFTERIQHAATELLPNGAFRRPAPGPNRQHAPQPNAERSSQP